MFLNMDQLQKQLDNNEFQEIGSMTSFKESRDTVSENKGDFTSRIKDLFDDEYNTDADDRGKVDSSKAWDASLVYHRNKGTDHKSTIQAHIMRMMHMFKDADILLIYNEDPMAKYND
ncbi:hypothetical protein Tco_0866692 [Tanacetum coccineum]